MVWPCAGLLITLEKVADNMVVHLTPEMVQFCVAPDGKSPIHVSADVVKGALFFDYHVQSKAENNRISFFVKIENLSRAIKSASAAAAERIQLKLTKKNAMPVLSFEITMGDSAGCSAVQVIHEVPIRIVTDQHELANYTEPPLGESSSAAVAVIFPSRDFKALKNVVERMRSVHEWMRITTRTGASSGGAAYGGDALRGGG